MDPFSMVVAIVAIAVISKTVMRIVDQKSKQTNVQLREEEKRYIRSLEERIDKLEDRLEQVEEENEKLEGHYDFLNRLLKDKY
jgi:cell division protein FtsB